MNIQAMIHHYGYIGVFFILLMENIGIPFPAETTLTLSGIEWTQGVFKLLPLLVTAAAGNILGSSVAYGIGRFLGRPVVVRFGRIVGITHERLDKANELFGKYESPVVLIGKFIAGVRVVIPYLAGINKMPFMVFSAYNAVSAVVWAAAFIVLGKYLGIEWKNYHAFFQKYLVPSILVVAVCVAAYVAFEVWRRRAAARRKRAHEAADKRPNGPR